MRRQPWFKSFATLLAVWFPLVVGEPSLLQPCPTHGSAAVATAQVAGHAGHTAQASPASQSDASPAHGHDTAPNGGHHDCTCIGCCCASLVSAIAPCAAELVVSARDPEPLTAYSTADLLPRPGPEFSRPYTTGPPRA